MGFWRRCVCVCEVYFDILFCRNLLDIFSHGAIFCYPPHEGEPPGPCTNMIKHPTCIVLYYIWLCVTMYVVYNILYIYIYTYVYIYIYQCLYDYRCDRCFKIQVHWNENSDPRPTWYCHCVCIPPQRCNYTERMRHHEKLSLRKMLKPALRSDIWVN